MAGTACEVGAAVWSSLENTPHEATLWPHVTSFHVQNAPTRPLAPQGPLGLPPWPETWVSSSTSRAERARQGGSGRRGAGGQHLREGAPGSALGATESSPCLPRGAFVSLLPPLRSPGVQGLLCHAPSASSSPSRHSSLYRLCGLWEHHLQPTRTHNHTCRQPGPSAWRSLRGALPHAQ